MLDRSFWPNSFASSEKAQNVRQIIVRTNRRDPRDGMRVSSIAGCEQRQSSRKTERQHTHFGHLELLREALCRGADEIGRLGLHAVIGNPWYLRGHHEEAAGRQRSREVYQPRFIDPEFVHAVDHDDPRRKANVIRHVDARGNAAPWKLKFVSRTSTG